MEKLHEKKQESREIFNGRILHIQEDVVTLPNGHKTTREVVRHVGAVCVIPVTDDGNVVMERQFRYPIYQVIWEIPAGKLDSKEEDPLDAAKWELREETGYSAENWQHLGEFYPAAAYCDEKLHMYLATDLHKGAQELDEDEFLDVEYVPLKKLVDMVMSGEITDAKTQTGILKAARILNV